MAVYGVDIDETLLLHHPEKPVYTDPGSVLANCRPIVAACARLRAMMQQGHEVHFITGRSALVKDATLLQLRQWVSAKVRAEQIHCNGPWAGYDSLKAHKTERLRALGAVLMVGDHEADELAAVAAGVPFLHAEAFAAGTPLPLPPSSPVSVHT